MVSASPDAVASDVYKSFIAATQGMSAPRRAAWLYDQRIGKRKDASSTFWLNELLRTGALDLDYVDNAMYCDLLDSTLTHKEIGQFLREYYWGSGYGFQRIVLPAAVKGFENDVWRTYIKSIIYEENTPSSHCEMFKAFIESLDFEVGDLPEHAAAFNDKMLAGYSVSLGHSLGYALGIETDADYQIALVYLSLRARYQEQVDLTEFFQVHISEYGEELHAQQTCHSIEEFLNQRLCTREEIEQGFRQAIVDTRDYMGAIRASIFAGSEAVLA